MKLLTEQDIVDRASKRGDVDRAEFRRQMRRWDFWTNLALFLILLVALFQPIHTWLHARLEFFAGVFVGTLLQSVGWLRDRWLWLKWFSHQ